MHRLFLLFALLFPVLAVAQSSPEPHVFGVQTLGYGSPEAREPLEIETPRSALEAFIGASRRKQFDRAALMLDFRALPESQRTERAEELAKRLYAVLERRVWISWDGLPDRPDGVVESPSKDSAMSGEVRRSFRLATLQVDNVPVSIRMNRVSIDGGDPVWVFSQQTVANVDMLFEAFGPTQMERSIPDSLRKEAILGLERWELIAAPLLLMLAAAAGVLVYRLAGRALPNAKVWWHRIIAGTQLPAALLVSTAILWATIEFIVTFSGPVSVMLDPLIIGGLILAMVFFISAVMDAVIELAVHEDVDDLSANEHEQLRNRYTNVSAARRLIILVLLFIGIGIVLSQTNLFTNLGLGILASAGVIGLTVGFAAREVLSNILASLQIAFSKSARIGDRLIYQGNLCSVEQIYFTYVQLLTWDDRRLIVPVNELVSTCFENLTLKDSQLIRHVTLLLDHRADPDLLRETFEEFVQEDERVLEEEESKVEVVGHTPQGMETRFCFTSPDPKVGWAAHTTLRELLLARCRELEEERDIVMLPIEMERHFDGRRSDRDEGARDDKR